MISSLKAMPSLSRSISFRLSRSKTHIPDCESRTQRKKSTDSDRLSSLLPTQCLRDMARLFFSGKREAERKRTSGMEEDLEQIGNCIHRIGMVAVQGDDDVPLGLHQAGLVGAAVAADLLVDHARAVRCATSAVRSVESLSTTMTSSTKAGMRESTSTMPFSSLRQGMTTVMRRSLYTDRMIADSARFSYQIS